jgi:hypothetical protein
MQTIIDLLNQLSEAQAHADVLALDRKAHEAAVMETVQPMLDDLAAEYSPQQEVVGVKIAELTEQVKAAILSTGESVKGARLTAIFQPGRVSWDTKALEGFAAAHPELARFRKVGEAFVVIRNAGK